MYHRIPWIGVNMSYERQMEAIIINLKLSLCHWCGTWERLCSLYLSCTSAFSLWTRSLGCLSQWVTHAFLLHSCGPNWGHLSALWQGRFCFLSACKDYKDAIYCTKTSDSNWPSLSKLSRSLRFKLHEDFESQLSGCQGSTMCACQLGFWLNRTYLVGWVVLLKLQISCAFWTFSIFPVHESVCLPWLKS